MNGRPHKILFLVNDDAFFVSHRLGLGRALRARGHEVVVAAGENGGRARIEAEGLRVVPIPFDRGGRSLRRDGLTLARVMDLYRRERPALVHHVTIKPVLYGSSAARVLGVPAIVNAISGLGYLFIERPHETARHRALRRGAQAAYRFALGAPHSRTIFQNPDDLTFFLQHGLVRFDNAVRIAGSGVDMDRFRPSSLPPGPPLVVLPARMLWDKGVGEFVTAARRLREQGSNARFALVGGDNTNNPASIGRSQLDRWTREGVVEWWGHRTDMPAVFAEAHLVVLPSYREGFPLALAEAAATGRACITTDVPGCREVVRDGENGWLVPVRDAAALAQTLTQALADPTELAARGARGAQRIARSYTQAQVVAAHVRMYDELLQKAAR